MIRFSISLGWLDPIRRALARRKVAFWIAVSATLLAIIATVIAYRLDVIVSYGDAESHLNIAKRVISSITPGLAQLGGIWLPLPHLLMVPFVANDFLWRSGLAGSIVSGVAYIVSCVYLYKLLELITKRVGPALIGTLTFMLNPAVLYLQSTPMTELCLIVFFILSTYFFVRFIYNQHDFLAFVYAAFYGFCATLSRYDGWFLVLIEAGIVAMLYVPRVLDMSKWPSWLGTQSWRQASAKDSETPASRKRIWHEMEGRLFFFSTLAFFGILLWLLWDGLILGDPLYFTHSQFSANSQQQSWLARGELPSYHHLWSAFSYYFVTALNSAGVLIFFVGIIGCISFFGQKKNAHRFSIGLLLLTPFIFYVVTLYLGQSVIFIPHLTPTTFDWTLFNVRYGVMMVPVVAFFVAYVLWRARPGAKWLVLFLILAQFGLYGVGYSQVLSYRDGTVGLSQAKHTDAQVWMQEHYDSGLVLIDDFARTLSVIRSGIPMQNTIYVGNKPYWEDSLRAPEKYASWIVMQKDDTVWNTFLDGGPMEGRLYKYFDKAYTSPEIIIFKRNSSVAADSL